MQEKIHETWGASCLQKVLINWFGVLYFTLGTIKLPNEISLLMERKPFYYYFFKSRWRSSINSFVPPMFALFWFRSTINQNFIHSTKSDCRNKQTKFIISPSFWHSLNLSSSLCFCISFTNVYVLRLCFCLLILRINLSALPMFMFFVCVFVSLYYV